MPTNPLKALNRRDAFPNISPLDFAVIIAGKTLIVESLISRINIPVVGVIGNGTYTSAIIKGLAYAGVYSVTTGDMRKYLATPFLVDAVEDAVQRGISQFGGNT